MVLYNNISAFPDNIHTQHLPLIGCGSKLAICNYISPNIHMDTSINNINIFYLDSIKYIIFVYHQSNGEVEDNGDKTSNSFSIKSAVALATPISPLDVVLCINIIVAGESTALSHSL